MYYDRKGNSITVDQWPSAEDRCVARTNVVGHGTVSTVHLVLDHSFDGGRPVIFETMIFGGEHDQWTGRYHTEEEAQAGHEAVVAWLKGEAPEPDGR